MKRGIRRRWVGAKRSDSALERILFSVEGEESDGGGDAGVVVGGGDGPAEGFEFFDAVGHDDGMAGEFEHVAVVPIVTDGHDVFAGNAAAAGPFGERRAFGGAAGNDVEDGEVAMLVFGVREAELRGARKAFDDGEGGAHAGDRSDEHDLNGIFAEAAFERSALGNEFAIALIVAAADGIVPVDALEDDLIFAGAVEDYGGAGAKIGRGGEDFAGDFARKQAAQMRFAGFGFDERPIIDDEGEFAGNLLGDGTCEVEAASGDEDDFDAARMGFEDGVAIGVGEFVTVVEQRAVDIHGDKANRHGSIVA